VSLGSCSEYNDSEDSQQADHISETQRLCFVYAIINNSKNEARRKRDSLPGQNKRFDADQLIPLFTA